MSSTEFRYVYHPPEELDSNIVGSIQVITSDERRTIRSTFLGEPFGEDRVVKGRLFLERRTEWAARMAIQNMQFQAEGQLGYPSPDETHDSLAV